jgi:hypothetical protein
VGGKAENQRKTKEKSNKIKCFGWISEPQKRLCIHLSILKTETYLGGGVGGGAVVGGSMPATTSQRIPLLVAQFRSIHFHSWLESNAAQFSTP